MPLVTAELDGISISDQVLVAEFGHMPYVNCIELLASIPFGEGFIFFLSGGKRRSSRQVDVTY